MYYTASISIHILLLLWNKWYISMRIFYLLRLSGCTIIKSTDQTLHRHALLSSLDFNPTMLLMVLYIFGHSLYGLNTASFLKLIRYPGYEWELLSADLLWISDSKWRLFNSGSRKCDWDLKSSGGDYGGTTDISFKVKNSLMESTVIMQHPKCLKCLVTCDDHSVANL